MRTVISILALVASQIAVPVAAEPVAGQFKTYGACASAFYQQLNKAWRDSGKPGKVLDYDPAAYCLWTGNSYLLLPVQ